MEGDEQERKLFVGGLNRSSTDEEVLKRYFEKYGHIVDCTVMRDQDRESRGFGFVLFDESSSIDQIMTDKKNGKEKNRLENQQSKCAAFDCASPRRGTSQRLLLKVT